MYTCVYPLFVPPDAIYTFQGYFNSLFSNIKNGLFKNKLFHGPLIAFTLFHLWGISKHAAMNECCVYLLPNLAHISFMTENY